MSPMPVTLPDAVRARLRPFAAIAVLAAVLTALAGIATSQPGEADVSIVDDETVYVVADATGEVRETVVVDWLKVEGEGEVRVVDRGSVLEVEPLEEDADFRVDGEEIAWDLRVDGRKDFFYRATTDKELPVDVEVTYTLDGREVAPDELAGESGRLRVEVAVHNRLETSRVTTYTTGAGETVSEKREFRQPLLCVVRIDFDGTRYDDIEEDAEMMTVTGDTMSYTFMTFPQPDDSAVIEMDATDIALDPIIVSVFPEMPSTPEIDVEASLAEVRDGAEGLAELSRAHMQVLDGLVTELDPAAFEDVASQADGFSQLTDGVTELRRGTEGVASLVDGQIAYLDGVIAGVDTTAFEDLSELAVAVEQLAAGVGEARTGVEDLSDLVELHAGLADAAASLNASMTPLLQSAVTSYPADPRIQGAYGMARAQAGVLTTLTAGGVMEVPVGPGVTATATVPGIGSVATSLDEVAAGLADAQAGLEAIAAEAAALDEVPAAFEQLRGALVVLRDGGVVAGERLPGLTYTASSLRDLAAGLRELEAGLGGAQDGLDELASLPGDLADLQATLRALRDGGTVAGNRLPGIATTAEGLDEMAAGLEEGITEARAGKATSEAMKRAAGDYDTFLGKPEGAEGRVRFIIKLDGIETADE